MAEGRRIKMAANNSWTGYETWARVFLFSKSVHCCQRRRNVFKSGGAEVNLIKWAWSFMCHDVILRHGP